MESELLAPVIRGILTAIQRATLDLRSRVLFTHTAPETKRNVVKMSEEEKSIELSSESAVQRASEGAERPAQVELAASSTWHTLTHFVTTVVLSANDTVQKSPAAKSSTSTAET